MSEPVSVIYRETYALFEKCRQNPGFRERFAPEARRRSVAIVSA